MAMNIENMINVLAILCGIFLGSVAYLGLGFIMMPLECWLGFVVFYLQVMFFMCLLSDMRDIDGLLWYLQGVINGDNAVLH